MKKSAASRKKSSAPWNVRVSAAGSLSMIWADSPPMYRSERRSPPSTIPKGCRRPMNATMIAANP